MHNHGKAVLSNGPQASAVYHGVTVPTCLCTRECLVDTLCVGISTIASAHSWCEFVRNQALHEAACACLFQSDVILFKRTLCTPGLSLKTLCIVILHIPPCKGSAQNQNTIVVLSIYIP